MAPSVNRRHKGEGSMYQRASDGRWMGVVDLGMMNGKRTRRTVSAPTLRELRPKMRALRQRTEAGVTGSDQSVEKWVTYWLDEISGVRPSTAKTYRGYIATWITPAVGAIKLSALAAEHARALMTHMETEGKAPATRKQVLSILSAALEVAVREGKIERNPCATVERPSLAAQEAHGHLSLEEVKQLSPHLVTHPNRARWLTALVLGLRQGEALGLAWADVHLDDDEPWMLIHKSQSRRDGRFVLGDPKSRASCRAIPIVPPVDQALRDWRKASGGRGLVWGPRHTRPEYDEWQALLKAAGLPPRPVHAARATAATILDAMGATPRQIADILGHSTVMVAQDHYVSSDAPQQRAVLAKGGDLLRS